MTRALLANAVVHELATGTVPTVVIAGVGKCGTNYLAGVLDRHGGIGSPPHDACKSLLMPRQGYCDEINWPCTEWHWRGNGRHTYLQHFARLGNHSAARFVYDQSTSYVAPVCPPLIASALVLRSQPKAPFRAVFLMLCDPVRAAWSRMNDVNIDSIYKDTGQSFAWAQITPADVIAMASLLAVGERPFKWGQSSRYNLSGEATVGAQLQFQLKLPLLIQSYIAEFNSSFVPLVSERAKQQPNYVPTAVAQTLGLPRAASEETKSVHSQAGSPGYLSSSGDEFDALVAKLRGVYAPVYRKLRGQLWQHRGEDLAKWWVPEMFDTS
eukprot:CAMPEP_0183360034 /NCGR_PEP_ID=MMETSP0164_2-20130417/54075_1 /TAXON_ID=221442 /ORGANISM="Coccolithus pelagicus ssp braarudi, Strain PLY182g" /LENGTH=324 /DNA_ID=CAMNT_0025534287 /DNA_START=85 /DNA_END=1059 /DNA_ORIENTATION=-